MNKNKKRVNREVRVLETRELISATGGKLGCMCGVPTSQPSIVNGMIAPRPQPSILNGIIAPRPSSGRPIINGIVAPRPRKG